MSEQNDAHTHVRTFLIADIRGFTSFTQTNGDEAAARLATTFAQLTRNAVEEFGGQLIELRGDEALAVFSSPRAALRAAVALRTKIAQFGESRPDQAFEIGIGIDAGEAVAVDTGGFRGSALNTAARLCGIAAPGSILTSDAVHHLASHVDGLRYVDQGRRSLKGLNDRIQVWEVRAEGSEIVRRDAPPVRPLDSIHAVPFEVLDDDFGLKIQDFVHGTLHRALNPGLLEQTPPRIPSAPAPEQPPRDTFRDVAIAGILVGGVIVIVLIAAVVLIVLHF